MEIRRAKKARVGFILGGFEIVGIVGVEKKGCDGSGRRGGHGYYSLLIIRSI